MRRASLHHVLAALMAVGVMSASVARAEIVLDQVIVDLVSANQPSEDIEVWNVGTDRAYVEVGAAEVVNPGQPDEHRVSDPDPEKLGLLVSPDRLVIEPGQRKRIRMVYLQERPAVDRIYRVAIKPVVGEVTATETALKLLIGYETLVIVRPQASTEMLQSSRAGDRLTIRNTGNSNVELYDGRQCKPDGTDCVDLFGKRLYAGAVWEQTLPKTGGVNFKIKSVSGYSARDF